MNETYFRVNFSSAVSTRKEYDKNGKRIAKLDIELPGPLLDPTISSNKVEMVLTKASIPLNMLPRLRLKVDIIRNYHQGNYEIATENCFMYGPLFYSNSLYYRNGQGIYSNQSSVNDLSMFKQWLTFQIYDNNTNLSNMAHDYLPYYDYFNLSTFENDINQSLLRNSSIVNGMVYPQIRFHFEDTSIRIYFSLEAAAEGQTLMKPLYGSEDARTNANYFSLFMSKENAEIFHNLPLVDMTKLFTNSSIVQSPVYFQRWAQYALDLEGRVPDGLIYENNKQWIYFDFHYFNPISLSPLTSIIIYSQDLPILSQVHGIVSPNIEIITNSMNTFSRISSSASSATQIGVLPIVEVFYPLITSEKDFQDVLVISKDAVSNAGPIILNTKSLAQYRNITFNVGYITKDGILNPLVIPENSNLSIQLTFIIKY